MEKKNIWYVHHYAGGPEIGMSYRCYYLTREFVRQGYNAIIVGASFHHLLRNNPVPQASAITIEYRHNIPYVLVKTNFYRKNGWGRLINIMLFTYRLRKYYKKIIKLVGEPDVIICASPHPTTYFATKYIADKTRAKHIFDVQDIWPLSLNQLLNVNKLHPLSILFRYAEKQAYTHCDFVVATMKNAKEHMIESGLDETKFYHIPNGISCEESESMRVTLPHEYQLLLDKLHNTKCFCIAYMGSHGIPNALDQLIDAMAEVYKIEPEKICAILVGEGSEKIRLIQKATNIDNIYFLDPLPKTYVQSFLNQVDCCFIGWQDKNLYNFGISANKLYDYMLSKKPIIQAVNTLYNPVYDANSGFNVLPNRPDLLSQTILNVSRMSEHELKQLGQNGYDYIQKNNLYSDLAKQFLALVDYKELSFKDTIQ